MTLRFFNGIQIDVPEDWSDRSTVLLAPKQDRNINLVVKRRPVPPSGLEHTVENYVGFMQARFGTLSNLQTKAMNVAGQKGVAVRFEAVQTGQGFRQTTLLYHAKGEELSLIHI